jgi:glycosyltransferase involved in cell wall biosynthesis
MWNGKTIAVILPTYRERDSIADCIRGFECLGIVDQILVVNNNAEPGTSEEVSRTSATEVLEPRQGYGAAIRRGLDEVDADLVCICEPDGTFNPTDLHKLLPFSTECNVVFGSRTVATFIWSGANMNVFLRWGNWTVAKMIEVLYNTPYLSDVGCTMRLLSRQTVDRIRPAFVGEGSSFGIELLLLAVIAEERFVQVPVNYLPRVGESSVTGQMGKTIVLGLQMIRMVLVLRMRRARLRRRLRPRPQP